MLDDKQLELLIDAADHEWIAAKYRVEMGVDRAMHGDECEEKALKLIRAARADLAAMRTPIATEALRAAGWEVTDEERFDDSPRACSQTYAPPFTDGALYFLAVRIKWSTEDDTGSAVVVMHGEDDDIEIPNTRTMYDLAQLVRLLGGDIVNS